MEPRPNFEALKQLQDSANELLHSSRFKRELVHHDQEKYVDEVCEASLQMLDICDTTKVVVLHVKDHLQELQSTFRTISVGETSIENKLRAYYIHRKNLKREMMNCLRSLKEMKSDHYPIDNNLAMVVDVLREVRVTTISTVESLMSLMSMPSPDSYKSYIGSFTSKFMRVNSLSLWENCDTAAFQTGNRRLEAVEIAIEDLEVELECIFRRLIETRVSLLNILTNQAITLR